MRHPIWIGLACAGVVVGAAACGGNGSSATTTAGHGGSESASSSAASTSGATSTSASTTGGMGGGGGNTPGPGATLKCDSSGMNGFDTYGAMAFVAVNKSIINNTLAEIAANGSANVGDSFSKIGSGNPPSTTDSAATFSGKLAAFLVWAYGGPNSIVYTDGKTYDGANQDMVTAHTGLNITAAQYTYFVTNIVVPSLESNGVKHGMGGASDPDDVGSCFAPVLLDMSFENTIIGH
jgi:hypothetical protein